MFINNHNQIVFLTRVYRKYKTEYALLNLRFLFTTKSFILFYYQDFLSPLSQQTFTRFLKEENLQSMSIKRSMFKLFCLKNNYHSLLNLGKNNLKLIYPKNTQIFDYKLVLNLASYKNLTLISTLYNAKMLRPSEIKKIFETSYLKNILHLIQLFYFKHISIENILTINFSGYGIQLNAGFSTTIINHAPGRLRNAKVFLYPNIKTFF